jgi:ketosteroid isomerase-like protein
MSQEMLKLVSAGLDAVNRGDLDAMLQMCDPEIEWIAIPGFLPDSEDYRGRAGVEAWFEKIGESLGEVHWDADEVVASDGRLMVALRLSATGRASGIEGEFRIFQAWTVRNDKLIRLESFLSRAEALDAAGLSE